MFDREQSAGHVVNWAARLFARDADRGLKPLGLSSGQILVLLVLTEVSPLSQRGLVDRVFIEQSTLAATLRRMERGGLVSRKPNPADRRASLFSLTPKALALMNGLNTVLNLGNDRAMVDFTSDERATLLALMQRVVRHLLANEARMAATRERIPAGRLVST